MLNIMPPPTTQRLLVTADLHLQTPRSPARFTARAPSPGKRRVDERRQVQRLQQLERRPEGPAPRALDAQLVDDEGAVLKSVPAAHVDLSTNVPSVRHSCRLRSKPAGEPVASTTTSYA